MRAGTATVVVHRVRASSVIVVMLQVGCAVRLEHVQHSGPTHRSECQANHRKLNQATW